MYTHVLFIEVFKAGTENKTLMASQEDIVALYLGKCDYLRRRIDLDVEHRKYKLQNGVYSLMNMGSNTIICDSWL